MYIFHTIITACLAGVFLAVPVYAGTDTGINLTEQEQLKIESEPDHSYRDGAEEEPYFSAEEFQGYYESLKPGLESGDSMAAIKLFLLCIGGSVSEAEVEQVLSDGYLISYIPDFQAAGVLSEDYRLPDGVSDQGTVVPMEGTRTTKEPSHDFTGITEYAEEALKLFSSDTVERNAVINIPMSTTESVLSGEVLSLTYYNSEPITVNFLNADGYADVSWHFANEIVADNSKLNLSVTHSEEEITFHLGEVVLPVPAEVRIRMESPNAKYNAYGTDGTFRKTYETDMNGYLVMDMTSDADSVTLAKEIVTEEKEAASGSNAEAVPPEEPEEPSMGGLRMTAIILFLGAMGLFMAAYFSETRRKDQ